jgi:hypothetical protein
MAGAHRVAAAALAVLLVSAAAGNAAAPRERPRGPVVDCSSRSGIGGLREYRSRWNLVVGPLALKGAAARPASYAPSFRGNKFPALVRGGHRVTLELPPETTRAGVGLVYASLPANNGGGYRVITFVACRRGEITNDIVDGWPVTGWSGGVRAANAQCVPLLVWLDDERVPRRHVIHLGVSDCA